MAQSTQGISTTAGLFKNAIPICGMLHIFANALKDIDGVLSSWKCYHGMLKKVERLVSHPERMDRFVARCVRGSACEKFIPVCQRKVGVMYDKRWGEVHQYCRKLVDVWPVFVACWCPRKYIGEDCGKQERPDDSGQVFDPGAITEVVGSKWFRAYTSMLLMLGELVESLVAWAERCPCHQHVQSAHGHHPIPMDVLRSECGPERAAQMRTLSCPFRGCRAPEMACGEVLSVLESAWKDSLAHLTLECKHLLAPSEWSSILQDFEAGKGYCAFVLTVKLQNWDELPWRLCGLAHFDEHQARQVAKDVLQKYDLLPVDKVHHNLTVKILSPTSPLRAELELFAAGRSRESLPLLMDTVLPLRGIPITERVIEAPHGRVKREIIHKNHKALSVSMALRVPDVERDILNSEEAFCQMCVFAEEAVSVRRIPRSLGLHGHPWIRALRTTPGSPSPQTSTWVSVLSAVLYRCDDTTAFENHKQAKRRHQMAVQKQAREAKPYVNVARKPLAIDDVLNKAAIEHLRERCRAEDIYSYTMDSGGAQLPHLTSLRGYLQQPLGSAQIADAHQFGMDTDEVVAVSGEGGGESVRVSFRVVSTRPAEKKTQPRGVSAGRKVSSDQIAVSLTHICVDSMGRSYAEVDVGVKSESHIALVSLKGSTNTWLRGNLQRHDGSIGAEGLVYSLRDFEPSGEALSHTLQNLMSMSALCETNNRYVPALEEERTLLRKMEEAGMVRSSAMDNDQCSWQLTPTAVQKMTIWRSLAPAVPALRPPVGMPIADYTSYELASRLLDDGWEWRPMPSGKREKGKLLPYRHLIEEGVAPNKIFYSTQVLSSEYLRCLFDKDFMVAIGVVVVHHGLEREHYQKMLKGTEYKPRTRPHREVLRGVDDDVDFLSLGHAAVDPGAAAAVPKGEGEEEEVEMDLEGALYELLEADGVVDALGGETTPVAEVGPRSPDGDEEAHPPLSPEATEVLAIVAIEPPVPPVPAPPPPPPVASEHRRKVGRGEAWGCFSIIWKPNAGKLGAWEGTCPFHRGTDTAPRCKKALNVTADVGRYDTFLLIKKWCVMAQQYTRKKNI